MRVLLMALCCQVLLLNAPAPARATASGEVLDAARSCARLEWADRAGAARGEAYRAAVACLSALYIHIAAGATPGAALEKQLARHLRELEAAYHASRNICSLREKLTQAPQGCGVYSSSPHEFVQLLKTMILDADAGPVRRDPALAEALGLD